MLHFTRKQYLALAAVLAATSCWALVPNFLRYMMGPPEAGGLGLSQWTVQPMRYLIASVCWLPFIFAAAGKHGGNLHAPSSGRSFVPKSIWLAALPPGIINFLLQSCWGTVGKYLESSFMGFAIKTGFLTTVLLGFIFYRDERRLAGKKLFWVGAIGCFAGLGMMAYETLMAGGKATVPGLVIMGVTTVLWGGYALLVKHFMQPFPAAQGMAVVTLYTCAGMLVLLFGAGDLGDLAGLGRLRWAILAASALLGISFGHSMYYFAIKNLGAVISIGITMMSPFITVLVARIFLGEEPGLLRYAGGLVIVGGGVLLLFAKSKVEKERHLERPLPPGAPVPDIAD